MMQFIVIQRITAIMIGESGACFYALNAANTHMNSYGHSIYRTLMVR